MDTDATEDQLALLAVSKRFIEDVCPLRTVRDGSWREAGAVADYRRRSAELGWYSMLVPEALGGGSVSGDGALDAALLAYVRGRALQPGSFVGTNVVAAAIVAAGSDDVRAEVLPALVGGERSASWAVASAGTTSPDGGVEGRLGADGVELSGTKTAVLDVDASSWLLVTFATPEGTGQALVQVDAPGVTVTALDSLDLSRTSAAVRFDTVPISPAFLVGSVGAVDRLVGDQLALASMLVAAEMVGAMDQDFATTVQYAKDRIAFGRPIGSFQGIKHQLADTSLALEMSKAITLAAARTIAAGDEYGPSAASMAKAFVGEAGIDLVQTCFQVYGGIGYTWEHDQHLFLRRITADAGLFGDASWHRERLCQLAGL